MAKMFYLYGRGNGRIQHGEIKGAVYWLRYYLAFIAGLLFASVSSWTLLLTAFAGWHLLRTVVQPNLQLIAPVAAPSWGRLLYVPLIALTRNLSTNLGFVRGWLEYRRGADYKQKLDDYLKDTQA